jgi:hypothetical protein
MENKMKPKSVKRFLIVALIGVVTAVHAGSRSGGGYTLNETTDGGGQYTTSANYAMDGSIGGMGGVSSNASSSATAKHGYIGQLTDATNLVITAAPASPNEEATSQLGGIAGLDDGTVTVMEGSNLLWSGPCHPIASISPAGLATAEIVFSNTYGSVTGVYLGVTGTMTLLVLDSSPDNFGRYANDGVPDNWQVKHFGTDNPNGGSTNNPDGDAFNNAQEYIADTDPTNRLSSFRICATSNLPPNRAVCFFSSAERAYTLLYRTNLTSGGWTNDPAQSNIGGNGKVMTFIDPSSRTTRFYRVRVQLP